MATSEQAIRVSAKGEFGQLQRGLKDLQGDLKNVMGTIDKGARKGGIFDDTSFRALDTFKQRFKGTMDELNGQFARQNDIIDSLTEKMKSANAIDKAGISETIKAREKELDVIRKQLYEVERLYKKRTDEAKNYDLKVPGLNNNGPSSAGGAISGGSFMLSSLTSTLGKLGGVIGNMSKFALGLAGVGSLMSMAQEAYEIAYQRQVGSLDLSQRIRGYGFSGSASDMYKDVANVGQRSRMGYKESESWAFQDAYTSKGGALPPDQQYGLQMFARGYGLDLNQLGNTLGSVKQLGGTVQPKEFADMIAGSVSTSGMLPRIMEVMQAHTTLLSSINTTFKDGSSSQILAYQTTLDKLGTENGMTKLTGQQGASLIQGLNGIYQPNNDKWLWTGIAALQNYKPDKYGSQGLYELQGSFEDGLQNSDNLPAMSKYLKAQAGGNNNVFKRLMQAWLQDGGYNATKRQVDELDAVTNGFSAFDQSKVDQVLGTMEKTDSGSKYLTERQGEVGQGILDTEARFDKALGDLGEKYILPLVTGLKEGVTDILEELDKSSSTLDDILDNVGAIAAIVGVAVAANAIGNIGNYLKSRKGGGGGGAAGKIAAEEEAAAAKAASDKITKGSGDLSIGKRVIAGELSASELLELQKLSGGSKPLQNQLEQLYRSTGDMDAVKHAVSGKASPGDIIDMLSNGDNKMQKQLSDHYESSKSMSSTMEKAAELAKGAESASAAASEAGFMSKFLGGGAGIVKKLFSGGSVLGGALELGMSLYNGDSVGKAGSKAGGLMVGSLGGGALGASIGTALGGGVGALFGGIGAVPGAAAGGAIGEFIGSIAGGMGGAYVGGKGYDAVTSSSAITAASGELTSFALKGNLNIDGLSAHGLEKLEELKTKGLISYTDMQTSTTANVASMTEEGKSYLLELQQQGLIAIGGLQENGSVKITALSDAGTNALNELNQAGSIAITDFQKTGKLQITNLSKEGAASLLDLQKDGSLALTSMDNNTLEKLKEIKKDTSGSMDDIYKEHQGMAKTLSTWLENVWTNIKGLLGLGTPGESTDGSAEAGGGTMWYDGEGNVTNGEYTGKYAEWINDAAQQYGFDPFLLAGIIKTESDFNPNAVNPSSGATGLGQFLATTAADEGLTDRTDPKASIYALAKYLDKRREWAGGNINEGIKGYGEGTQEYLNKVLKNQELMRQQYSKDSGTGDSSVGGNVGGSVFNNWRSHINAPFGENRGDHNHGGLDLAATQGTQLNALAGGKIAFINVDDGSANDPDGRANTNAGGSEVGVRMANGKTYFYSHLSKINDAILKEWTSGDHDIGIKAGQYIGKSGGNPGVPGSGSSTTGNHLHLGYMDSSNNYLDPALLLDSLGVGDSTVGQFANNTNISQNQTKELRVTVDVNLKGDNLSQLNNATVSQLKNLITQVVQSIKAQDLAMYPTVRRV